MATNSAEWPPSPTRPTPSGSSNRAERRQRVDGLASCPPAGAPPGSRGCCGVGPAPAARPEKMSRLNSGWLQGQSAPGAATKPRRDQSICKPRFCGSNWPARGPEASTSDKDRRCCRRSGAGNCQERARTPGPSRPKPPRLWSNVLPEATLPACDPHGFRSTVALYAARRVRLRGFHR